MLSQRSPGRGCRDVGPTVATLAVNEPTFSTAAYAIDDRNDEGGRIDGDAGHDYCSVEAC